MINFTLSFILTLCLLQPATTVCPFLPNCLQCLDPRSCDKCQLNFALTENKCTLRVNAESIAQKPPSPNQQSQQDNSFAISQTLTFSGIGADPTNPCGYWVGDLGICAFCNEGYELIMGKCLMKVEKCRNFGEDKKCKKCIETLFLEDNGNCIDRNCQRSGYYNCEKCKSGFVKNFYQICLDPNCEQYENGTCAKCIKGHSIQDGKCGIITSTTIITVKNVTNKTTTTTTTTKQSITTLITTIITIHTGCLLFDPRGGCHRCFDDYFLRNGLCRGIDEFCEKFDQEDGTCFSCTQNYQLINNRCVSDDPTQNCQIFRDRECEKCIDRYYSLNGVCLEVDRSCATYDDGDGFCLTCHEGYRLVGGKCLLIFSRSGVDSNNTDDQTSLVSEFSKFYCLEYQGETDYCLRCYARFYAFKGFCWRVQPLCRTYNDDNGQCLSCYEGYRLDESSCLVDFSTNPFLNCKEYSPETSLCLACMKRYFLFEGICLQVYPECKEYDEKTGECTSCFNGYFLLEGQCQIVATALSVPFCQNYNPLDPRQCLKCVTGYFLQTNVCNKVSPTCEDSDEDGSCTSCISDRYQLTNGKCLDRVKNCADLRLNGCRRCEQGFSLRDGKCE